MKKVLFSLAAIPMLVLGLVSWSAVTTYAQNQQQNRNYGNQNYHFNPTPARPPVLDIGANGQALIRGTVDSVNNNTIVVRSWGGYWNINVRPNTRFAAGNLYTIRAGDFIGANGTATNNSLTINATYVRDWSRAR